MLTGGRRNEITQAKWEHVDWQRRTLLVPVSKSGKPRTIALNGAAIALLRSVPRVPGQRVHLPLALQRPSVRVAVLSLGSHQAPCRSGDVRLHDLRHSFASFLVNEGVSLYVVQGLLGHSQVRMTQRYAHLAPQTLLDAAEVVATVIRDGPTVRTAAE